MGKLYFLDEEEKSRVLSLHESAAKRQYLKEDAIKDFEAKIPQETKYKFNKMDNGWQAAGTNVQKIVDALNSFTATEYTLYNNYLALKKPEGVTGLTGIINKEMEYDNLEDVKKVADALKRLGLTGTYEIDDKDKYGQKKTPTFRVNSFKIVKGVTPVVDPKKAAVVDPKKAAVVDPKVAYQQRAKQVNQQTINTTIEIQKLLGQEPTGNLDATYVEKVIDLLKQ
jgi:hypothetical protein